MPTLAWSCKQCTYLNNTEGACSMCGYKPEVKQASDQNKITEAFDCVRVRYDIYGEVRWTDSRDAFKIAAENIHTEEALDFCSKYMGHVITIMSNQKVGFNHQYKDCFILAYEFCAQIIAHILHNKLEPHFKVLETLPLLFARAQSQTSSNLYRSQIGANVRRTCVQKFLDLNGFNLLADTVAYISPEGLSKICPLLEQLKYINEAKDSNVRITTCLYERATKIDQDSLPRNCGFWCVVLRELMSYYSDNQKMEEAIRQHYYRLINYTLQSDILNNRLMGLENVEKVVEDNIDENFVRKWLFHDIKVLSLLFNDKIHEQIVAKSRNLMKALIGRGWLEVKDVCLIWDAALGKHGALVKEISELLAVIAMEDPDNNRYRSGRYGASKMYNNNRSHFNNHSMDRSLWQQRSRGNNSNHPINLLGDNNNNNNNQFNQGQEDGISLGLLRHMYSRINGHPTETIVFIDAVLRYDNGGEFESTNTYSSSAGSGKKKKKGINGKAQDLFFGTTDRANVTINCLEFLVLRITTMNEDIERKKMLFNLYKKTIASTGGENFFYPSMCNQLEYVRDAENKNPDEVKKSTSVALIQVLLEVRNEKRMYHNPDKGLNIIIKTESGGVDLIEFFLKECKSCSARLAKYKDETAMEAIRKRLDSLGFIAKNKSLFKFAHIQDLWDSFFKCQNSKFMDILMDWLFVGRDDGKKNQDSEVDAYFGDEVAYRILVDLFGSETGLPYCDTKLGFKAFKNFFLGLNQWTNLGIIKVDNNNGGQSFRFVGLDPIYSPQKKVKTIHGLETVWKISMECMDMEVFNLAKNLIIDGCNVPNDKKIESHNDPVKIEILKRLKSLLIENHNNESAMAVQTTQRALSIIQDLLQSFFFNENALENTSLTILTRTHYKSENNNNKKKPYRSSLIQQDYASAVCEIYDLLSSLSKTGTVSHIKIIWDFLKSLPPRPLIMEEFSNVLQIDDDSAFRNALPIFNVYSSDIVLKVIRIKIIQACVANDHNLLMLLSSKQSCKPWLHSVLQVCCSKKNALQNKLSSSSSSSHVENNAGNRNNITLLLKETAVSIVHIMRLLQLHMDNFTMEPDWISYLIQMTNTWADDEEIVHLSIQIIFDSHQDEKKKKMLFISNNYSFVLRSLSLESKFIAIQTYVSNYFQSVVKETDDEKFLITALNNFSLDLEEGRYLSSQDASLFFNNLMSVIMQMKMTSENDVASDVEKHIVNVLSEKIVSYSKNLSGKEPFKCITGISRCLYECLSRDPSNEKSAAIKNSMRRVSFLGMKNDPLGTLSNLMVGMFTRGKLSFESVVEERLAAVQGLCTLFQLFSCEDEKKWGEIMYQIGQFIDEHFPTKDVTMSNKANLMFRKTHVGLKNQGNTCYMNSLIQQLYMMKKPFREDILALELPRLLLKVNDNSPSGSKSKITESRAGAYRICYELQRTFQFLAGSDRRSFDTKDLVNACEHLKLYYSVTAQNDTREFCDKLMESMETSKIQPLTRCLHTCFGGQAVGQSHFKECNHLSETRDTFTTVELPVKDMHTLLKAFESYVRSEVMDGADAIHCDKCYQKRVGTRRSCFDLDTLPKLLIIHLKRFVTDLTSGELIKVQDRLEFPNELDMAPYTMQSLDTKSSTSIEPKLYDLKGVLVHDGDLNIGHYYSYIQDRETGKWYHFDDENVNPFESSKIMEECFGGGDNEKKSAYMLFYEERESYNGGNNTRNNNHMMMSTTMDLTSNTSSSTSSSLVKVVNTSIRRKVVVHRDKTAMLKQHVQTGVEKPLLNTSSSSSLSSKASHLQPENASATPLLHIGTVQRTRSLSFDNDVQNQSIFPVMKKKSLGHEGRIASLKRARSVTIEHTADTLDIMQTDASNSYDNNNRIKRRKIANMNHPNASQSTTTSTSLRDQILSELKLEPYSTLIRLDHYIECFCSILGHYLRTPAATEQQQQHLQVVNNSGLNTYKNCFQFLLIYFFKVLVYQKEANLEKWRSMLNFVIEEKGEPYAKMLLDYLRIDGTKWSRIVADAPSTHLTMVKVVIKKAIKKCDLAENDEGIAMFDLQDAERTASESIDLTGDNESKTGDYGDEKGMEHILHATETLGNDKAQLTQQVNEYSSYTPSHGQGEPVIEALSQEYDYNENDVVDLSQDALSDGHAVV